MLDTVPNYLRGRTTGAALPCLEEHWLSNPDAGTLACRFEDQGDFQVFVPYSLPPVVNYNSIMDLVTEAHSCTGILEGLGRVMQN